MHCLLDKSVVRRGLRGLVGGTLTEDVRHSLRMLATFAPGELHISLQMLHILTHSVKVPQARLIIARTTILYPVKYTQRWARRLRNMGFGREDAYLLSLATFGTDQLKEGRILGVQVLVTYDYGLQNHFLAVQPQLETRLQRMVTQLPPPYDSARLPAVRRPDQITFPPHS
jgi:hypothetical protein